MNIHIVFPSHKLIVQKSSFIGNLVICGEVWLGGVRPSWARLMYGVDHPYPAPHMVDHLICGKSYMNILSAEEQFLTTQCHCHHGLVCTLVLTASSSSSSATASPFFFLPWKRVSWTFLGCHYASFPNRSLSFLEYCPTLPWASLASSHEVQLSVWPSQKPSDLSGLEPDGPAWGSLGLSVLDCLSKGPAYRLWLFQEPSDLSGLNQDSPTWFAVNFALEYLFRTVEV